MAVDVGIIPRIRRRIEEIRERIRRREILRPESERAAIEIGKGRLIARGKERVKGVTEKVREVAPGIIPRVGEILAEWYPGKRLMRVIAPKTEIVKPGEVTYREAEEKYPVKKERGIHY